MRASPHMFKYLMILYLNKKTALCYCLVLAFESCCFGFWEKSFIFFYFLKKPKSMGTYSSFYEITLFLCFLMIFKNVWYVTLLVQITVPYGMVLVELCSIKWCRHPHNYLKLNNLWWPSMMYCITWRRLWCTLLKTRGLA